MKKYFIICLVNLLFSNLWSQWSTDPTVNTVLDKPGDQRAPLIATDGKGGAIVAWDEDNGVFANWVDKFGFRRWGNDGMRISPVGRIAHLTNIASSGQGGAVIVWSDFTNAREVGFEVVRIIENEIFAQRVDSLGQLVWDADGVGVRTKIDSTTVGGLNLVTSNNEEFIVFWFEDRKHPYPQTGPWDFYAQKIGSDGDLQWQSNGNLISVQGSLHNILFRIVPDNSGGFFLARNGNVNQDPIIEHVLTNGELFLPGGVQVFEGGGFEIVSDEAGGVIMAAVSFPRKATVQRIDSMGNFLWNDNGVVVKDTLTGFVFFDITEDGKHGAIVLWSEGGGEDILLQRVGNDGIQLWQPGGVPLLKAGFLMSDNEGGIIIVLSELIEDSVRTFKQSVQKFDSSGMVKWDIQGTLYQVRQNDPGGFREYISDLRGGIILAWDEFNFQTSWDVVMQQVNREGELGVLITSVQESPSTVLPREYRLFQNYPNPFNPETTIAFTLKKTGFVSVRIYDLQGKEVITLAKKELPAGEHRVVWHGQANSGKEVASGVYFYRLSVNDFRAVRKLVLLR